MNNASVRPQQPALPHLPPCQGNKTASLLRQSILASMLGERVLMITHSTPAVIAHQLKRMGYPCKADGQVVSGRCQGQPWSITVQMVSHSRN